jgi:long-chain acyl-CoA synthetase
MTNASIRTLAEFPFHVSGRFPKTVLVGHCVGSELVEQSSHEFFERVRDLSLGLEAVGVNAGDRVAILSDSCPEWTITDLAVLSAGAVTVPVYPTLPADQVGFILAHSGARVVVVSDRAQAAKVREQRHRLPEVDTLVVIDLSGSRPAGAGMGERSLAEVIDEGHKRLVSEDGLARLYKERAHAVEPEALATIIYTSGTTGDPKGVMLSHHNLLANIEDVAGAIDITDADIALSFLPISHAFERTAVYLYLYKGATVVFAEGLDTVGRDLQRVRPTVMTGVPRVYEKLRAGIVAAVAAAPRYRQALFAWALAVGHRVASAKLAGLSPGMWTCLQQSMADRLVLSKIRARTGGRLRFVVSGSAPLGREVAEFLYAVGLPVLEGYGLTETAPVLTTNPLNAARLGTVGTAMPSVELRIAEDGEILARGPNVMMGYYEDSEATREAMEGDWFHTGDIGRIDSEGYLSITDRKKQIIVTAGGKNIAPQPIEALIKRDPIVAEAMLIGDRRPFITALLIPDFTALEKRLARDGRAEGSWAELAIREDVLGIFQLVVDEANAELASFQQVKRFALLPVEFSVSTGELTPTLKIKRRVIEARWNDAIERLYLT